ncbi:endogenous retroviral envelope protein HEMO-like [Epinephelus moara]|uniref:endogenous retroviral envelope protein HEMO-like n=1 Tax=Epinephelus moara TaxID=300413 RepID=UPI00214F2CEE|nr:endogenous retroviral envelope protein HEMO-like [Epinephelus moara]
MPLILNLLTLILVRSTVGALQVAKAPDVRTDDINTFLTIAWQVAGHISPNSSCYVCGLMPYTAADGLPLMAVPISDCDTCQLLRIPLSQSYTRNDCSSLSKMRPLNCSRGHSNCDKCLKPPKPVPILLTPQKFPWCLENDGNTPVGESDCLHTFKWNTKQTNTEFKSLDSGRHQCLEAAGPARFIALAHRTASCSISSPVGMYWVCGNLAYPHLPVDYKGRCGLAYVIPAMRVTNYLPRKPPPKRVRRGTSDIFGTHKQSPFKNIVGPLLPFYGVMSALDQIADLSHAIEVIANETSRALILLSSELASVRLLALQNRAALDFLLAAQGGTCSVIGSECCTFVPDYNATINDIVNHLLGTANSIHQDSSSLFDWFKPNFGSLGYRIVEGLIVLAVFIVILSFFISCMKKIIFSLK